LTATPPPADEARSAQGLPPVQAPWPGQQAPAFAPQGSAPPSSAPPSAKSSTQANVDRATAITEDLIDRGAPWSARTTWTIVLAEAIVAGILGLIFLFKPLGGSSTTLQLVGIVLLVGALISAFQLWRHMVRPDLETLAAFRAGSGVTVGLVVIVATFLTAVTDAVSAALAVVVGIGFIVFGLTGVATSFVRRQSAAPLPAIALIVNAGLALAGVVLMLAGAAGPSAVSGIFNLLGILLIVAGLGLGGYSYLLRQQEMSGVRR
jgi:uncharacterized membrane protein HdeD (DUF308 family)